MKNITLRERKQLISNDIQNLYNDIIQQNNISQVRIFDVLREAQTVVLSLIENGKNNDALFLSKDIRQLNELINYHMNLTLKGGE